MSRHASEPHQRPGTAATHSRPGPGGGGADGQCPPECQHGRRRPPGSRLPPAVDLRPLATPILGRLTALASSARPIAVTSRHASEPDQRPASAAAHSRPGRGGRGVDQCLISSARSTRPTAVMSRPAIEPHQRPAPAAAHSRPGPGGGGADGQGPPQRQHGRRQPQTRWLPPAADPSPCRPARRIRCTAHLGTLHSRKRVADGHPPTTLPRRTPPS